MKVVVNKKETEYVIGTCDQCCGYYPRVECNVNKSILYDIYCPNCGSGVDSDVLWKAVMNWNKMIRNKNKENRKNERYSNTQQRF